jgi:hypothetical protein
MKAKNDIIFTGPLALAALEGRKTQFRRVAKPQPEWRGNGWTAPGTKDMLWADGDVIPFGEGPHRHPPGTRLWVKEKWAAHWMYDNVPPSKARSTLPDDNRWYLADPEDSPGTHGCPAKGYTGRWRSALYMPRWASRLTIEIMSVRLERLQSITESDVCAELGLSPITRDVKLPIFRGLWDVMNKKHLWESNPWVFRYEFRKDQTDDGK